jgi:tetratricopeptide (TPR) repeat protein
MAIADLEISINASWAESLKTAAETLPHNNIEARSMTKSAQMKEPTTSDEVEALHKLLRSDPQRFLQIVNDWINENPQNPHAYFDRHMAWMTLGEPRRALNDLSKVIQLDPEPVAFRSRGQAYRHIGEYEEALKDFGRGEAIDPTQWQEDAFGLLYQADCHARLGNEAAALACCARLRDDFWTPGLDGAPSGGKAEIAEKLRRIAADARGRRA